jgi:lysyl-tRNA synthetase, class II
MNMEKISDLLQKRKEKIEELKINKINLFPNGFIVSHTVRDIRNIIGKDPESLGENGPVFTAAGRMMAINNFGKSAFIRFRDRSGQLQGYIRKDQIGNEAYHLFKQLDIGDFVGLKGTMFQTRTGEWTLLVRELNLLCKATRPLPEKFHGLGSGKTLPSALY